MSGRKETDESSAMPTSRHRNSLALSMVRSKNLSNPSIRILTLGILQSQVAQRRGIELQVLSQFPSRETVQTYEEIEKELVDFYKDLLAEPVPKRNREIPSITHSIPAIISQDQNKHIM